MLRLQLTMCLLFLGSLLPGSAQTSLSSLQTNDLDRAAQVQVHLLAVKNLGLELSTGAVKNDYGRGVSFLSFDAKNTSKNAISKLQFAVHIVSQSRSILGGESWCSPEIILPGESRHIETYFPKILDSQTVLVAHVSNAISGNSLFQVSPKRIKEAITANDLAPLTVEPYPLTGVQLPDALCSPDWCNWCRFIAMEDCDEGIKSFNCSIGTCSCSYTCK